MTTDTRTWEEKMADSWKLPVVECPGCGRMSDTDGECTACSEAEVKAMVKLASLIGLAMAI